MVKKRQNKDKKQDSKNQESELMVIEIEPSAEELIAIALKRLDHLIERSRKLRARAHKINTELQQIAL
jgi:hypothetical protein